MISIINYKIIRILTVFSIVLASILFLPTATTAEEQDQADIKMQFEQAFQQMLVDPSNVDIALKYAGLAVKLGNYEAAIPPLERILIFNPDLPKIKLEVGVLYYQLNSMEMAKSYFEGAIKSKDVTEETRASAMEYLSKIKG